MNKHDLISYNKEYMLHVKSYSSQNEKEPFATGKKITSFESHTLIFMNLLGSD